MATCCEDTIVPLVFPFALEHLVSPDWKFRDAAVMAVGEWFLVSVNMWWCECVTVTMMVWVCDCDCDSVSVWLWICDGVSVTVTVMVWVCDCDGVSVWLLLWWCTCMWIPGSILEGPDPTVLQEHLSGVSCEDSDILLIHNSYRILIPCVIWRLMCT